MRLMEVVAPGSTGNAVITGVSQEQYREINESPLSKQSLEWEAFGKES